MDLQTIFHYRPQISELAKKYGVISVRLFGSIARGEERTDSDVDLLVKLEEGRTIMDAGGFQYTVQELLGVKVDVVPFRGNYETDFIRRITPECVDVL